MASKASFDAASHATVRASSDPLGGDSMTRTISLWLIASTLFACDADTKEVTTGLECGPGTEAADGLCVPTEGDTDEPGDDSGEPPGDDSGVPEPDDTGETGDTGSDDDTGSTEDTGALDDTGFTEDTGEPWMAGRCSDDLSFDRIWDG